MKRRTLCLMALALGLNLAVGCGKKNEKRGADWVQDGFYVASNDVGNKVVFPLVVIKSVGSTTSVYQLNTIQSFSGFDFGSSQTNYAGGPLTTSSLGGVYGELKRISKEDIEMVMHGEIFSTDPSRNQIVKTYTMKQQSKEAALSVLRSFVKSTSLGSRYTSSQEQVCREAFGIPCNEVYSK